MKTPFLFAIVVAMFCGSCHKTDIPTNHGLIGDDGIVDPAETYDFSPELADGSTRYISSDVVLRYDEGGVLAQYDIVSGRSVYRFVELSTGCVVEFSCRTVAGEGELTDAHLYVEGSEIGIARAYMHRVNSTGAWIEILAPGDKHYVLVMTGM
ncbi:hypothetical protein [uncultured Muribaculum sp.]|uniref:hypothetical protein n=1 Tax=uncultured Muribaculum sp. TaxID=1918613 RepID=UPI0025FAF147|nr:hypothetical protein [uncultured Muribaculum sp.]